MLADVAALGCVDSDRTGSPLREQGAVYGGDRVRLRGTPEARPLRFERRLRRRELRGLGRIGTVPEVHRFTDGCASFSAAGAEGYARSALIAARDKSFALVPFVGSTPFSPTPRTPSVPSTIILTSTISATVLLPRGGTASTAALI